jgi:hypothetical protein
MNNINQYKVICLKDNVLCYKKIKHLTRDELEKQFTHWNVYSFEELLQRWNQQIESKVTKLKWIYY